MVRALFNTYPVAFDCPGGGEVQLLEYKSSLEDLGVEVLLYDPWRPQFDQADVVHYFSVQGGSMNFCSHVKRRGIPLVISPIIWLTEENIPCFPMDEIGELLRISDLILPNSYAEKDQLAAAFGQPGEKFAVILNAVGRQFTERVSGELFRERFDISGPYVLNMANVEPRKNQIALARAMRGLDMTLVIAGRVRDEAYFERVMREGDGFVRHIGALPYGEAIQKSAYAGCEVFALPSLLETPGLAALEAASQGARVVASSIGCAKEYFQDLATYVNPHDVADIRNGLETELSKIRGDDLRKRVLSLYTWDKSAKALLEAYNRVRAERAEGATAR